jgi:quercetin dioxygenase-like cupin family protein
LEGYHRDRRFARIAEAGLGAQAKQETAGKQTAIEGELMTNGKAKDARPGDAPGSNAGMENRAPTLRYWHIYSDSEGVSHFREIDLPFKARSVPGMDDPPAVLPLDSQPGVAFVRLAPGQVEDWHPAPRSVFLIAIQGGSRVTVGDGTVKEFGPGDVVFMDDTTGRGHLTEPIGNVAHVALIVPVESVKK